MEITQFRSSDPQVYIHERINGLPAEIKHYTLYLHLHTCMHTHMSAYIYTTQVNNRERYGFTDTGNRCSRVLWRKREELQAFLLAY